jgi:hypothetical protein
MQCKGLAYQVIRVWCSQICQSRYCLLVRARLHLPVIVNHRRLRRKIVVSGEPPTDSILFYSLYRAQHLLRSSMQNIAVLVASIAIATLLAWAGFRTWRLKNRIVKWGGAGLWALLSLTMLSASALTSLGMIKQRSRAAPIPDIKGAATPEAHCAWQGYLRRSLWRVPFTHRHAHRRI